MSTALQWTRQLSGQRSLTMDTKLDVFLQVRELVVIGIDNVETALALFFDAMNSSGSADALRLFKRVAAVKFDYARKVALATDVNEATALQFAYCRAKLKSPSNSFELLLTAAAARVRFFDKSHAL